MHVSKVPQGHMTKTSEAVIPKGAIFFETVLNSLLPDFSFAPRESPISVN